MADDYLLISDAIAGLDEKGKFGTAFRKLTECGADKRFDLQNQQKM